MDEPIQIPGYWKENIRRSLRDWEGREVLVGLLVIFLTALGYSFWTKNAEISKMAATATAGYVSLLIFVISPQQMWRDAQERIAVYQESLRPHVSFVFEPRRPTLLTDFLGS
jgi:drug/metabolite transporter (DMT)-like permease